LTAGLQRGIGSLRDDLKARIAASVAPTSFIAPTVRKSWVDVPIARPRSRASPSRRFTLMRSPLDAKAAASPTTLRAAA